MDSKNKLKKSLKLNTAALGERSREIYLNSIAAGDTSLNAERSAL
jgi:hypothetical protein